MRIENWSLVSEPDPYLPPECQVQYLNGEVYEHPQFEDGTNVTTSALDCVESGNIKTKSGSLYELGEVHPEYEKAFPNAKERILKTGK